MILFPGMEGFEVLFDTARNIAFFTKGANSTWAAREGTSLLFLLLQASDYAQLTDCYHAKPLSFSKN